MLIYIVLGDIFIGTGKTHMKRCSQGVFLMTTIYAFVPIERDYSVNTYLWILRSHEGLREVNEQAREQSERAKQV